MRLPKPTLVVLLGLILALGSASTASAAARHHQVRAHAAMLKRNAIARHNAWQHKACDAGNRTCTSPFFEPTECHGPLPGSTGPNVPSHTPQYACVGWMAMRTPINLFQNQGWVCVVDTWWSQYGNFIKGKIACVRDTA